MCCCCNSLRLAVVSKIIVDTISGKQRPGGGGVQAAAGARLAAAAGAEISLHAPVGVDFDATLLAPLVHDYAVDTTCVVPLDGVGCKGGPPNITVCGTCGLLYDTVYPTGAFLA